MDLYEHLDKRKDEPFLDYCCDVRTFVRHSNIAL